MKPVAMMLLVFSAAQAEPSSSWEAMPRPVMTIDLQRTMTGRDVLFRARVVDVEDQGGRLVARLVTTGVGATGATVPARLLISAAITSSQADGLPRRPAVFAVRVDHVKSRLVESDDRIDIDAEVIGTMLEP